jgi:hypothetical protein
MPTMLERAQLGWGASKRWWRGLAAMHAVSAIVAVTCAWTRPEHGIVAAALPAIGIFVPVVAFILRGRANAAFAAGEAWRRANLLRDGLAYEPTAREYATLALEAATAGKNDQTRGSAPYFASTLGTGYPRLLENLAESAFHSVDGASKTAQRCQVIAGLAVALIVLAVLAVLGAPLAAAAPGTDRTLAEIGPQVAGVASVALTVFATGQIVELAIAFAGLARTAQQVMDRALDLAEGAPSEGAVLSLMGVYDGALAAVGAPIFAASDSAKMDAEWAQVLARRVAKTATPATPS